MTGIDANTIADIVKTVTKSVTKTVTKTVKDILEREMQNLQQLSSTKSSLNPLTSESSSPRRNRETHPQLSPPSPELISAANSTGNTTPQMPPGMKMK